MEPGTSPVATKLLPFSYEGEELPQFRGRFILFCLYLSRLGKSFAIYQVFCCVRWPGYMFARFSWS